MRVVVVVVVVWSLWLEEVGASPPSPKAENKLRSTTRSTGLAHALKAFKDFWDPREFRLWTSLKSPKVKEITDASGLVYVVVSTPLWSGPDLMGLLPRVCVNSKDLLGGASFVRHEIRGAVKAAGLAPPWLTT